MSVETIFKPSTSDFISAVPNDAITSEMFGHNFLNLRE